MRVLAIDDNQVSLKLYRDQLEPEGMEVVGAETGEEGLELARTRTFDIILLDLDLPDMTGKELLVRMRGEKIGTAIMIVSGSVDIDTKVKTFSGGADEFLPKPYHRDELIARMQAIVRRKRGGQDAIIQVGNLAVHLDKRVVRVNDSHLHLTGHEYRVLELLALRHGTAVTKQMFLNHLYGGIDEPGFKIIDVFVCKIRKKIAAANDGKHYIETIWGRGYVLREATAGQAAA